MISRSVTGLSGLVSLLEADNNINKMFENNISGSKGLINLFNTAESWSPLDLGIKLLSWASNTNSFQESTGVTPITSAGQSVGLVLDKSLELAETSLGIGTDYTNIGFENFSTSGSSFIAEKTIAGGNDYAISSSAFSVVSGKPYKVKLDVAQCSNNFNILFSVSTNSRSTPFTISAPGLYEFYLYPNATGIFSITLQNAQLQLIETVSIEVIEVAGNHWSQKTSPARPIYSVIPVTGRKNLADYTDDLSGWGVRSVTRTLGQPDPFGGSTASQVLCNINSDIHIVTRPLSGFIPGETYTVSYNFKGVGIGKISVGSTSAGLGLNGTIRLDLIAGTINSVYSGFSNATLIPIGDGWYNFKYNFIAVQSTLTAIVYITDDTFQTVYAGDGVSGFLINRVQFEKSEVPTSYQRVGEYYDITEEGVESIYYYHYDSIDDAISVVLPEIIDGQIVINSIVGTWIAPLTFAGGTFTFGPDTYTGGPTGLIEILGNAETDIFILKEVMTSEEQSKLINYLIEQGSPGLITLGDNLFVNGTFDTDLSGITSSSGAYWEDGKLRCSDGNFFISAVAEGAKKLLVSWEQSINSGTRSRVRLRNQTNSADVGPFSYYTGTALITLLIDTPAGLSLTFTCETGNDISFDNIKVREVIFP